MGAKKGKTDNYLSVEILRDLADKMMELETKNLKKWSKKPATKRGEDLQGLIEAKFPGIGEEALRIAMWVDLVLLYIRDELNLVDVGACLFCRNIRVKHNNNADMRLNALPPYFVAALWLL